jgi:hypothetical protein
MNPNNLSGINTPFQNLVTNKSITLNNTGGNVFIPTNKGTAVFPVKNNMTDLKHKVQRITRQNNDLSMMATINLQQDSQDWLSKLFKFLNPSNSGFLLASDFQFVNKGIPKYAELVSKLDLTGDQSITFNEFVCGMTKLALDRYPDQIVIRRNFTMSDYLNQFELIANGLIKETCEELWNFLNQ